MTLPPHFLSVPVKSDPKTWSDPRHRRGYEGEKLAIEYLKRRGWDILSHRFRMGRFEIDLIASRGHLIAFIEVKTRYSTAFGSPLEAITWTKRREIVRVASAWVDRFGVPDQVYRFDVIGVTLKGERPQIEHVQDAFRAG